MLSCSGEQQYLEKSVGNFARSRFHENRCCIESFAIEGVIPRVLQPLAMVLWFHEVGQRWRGNDLQEDVERVRLAVQRNLRV